MRPLSERKQEIIEYLNKDSVIHAKAALDQLVGDLGYKQEHAASGVPAQEEEVR